MSKTRIGKIARLPRALRHQLNQRLHDGEPGNQLVEWLNGLPEVQTVLAAEFVGRPINAQNLTDWKQGGYRDWLAQQEALELAQRLGEDAAELAEEGQPPLTDTLALWLAARYAVATRQVAQTEGAEGWRLLRELCADVVELRRSDHSAERLRLEREQWAAEQRQSEDKKESAAKLAPIHALINATLLRHSYDAEIRETGQVPPEVRQFLATVAPPEAGADGGPPKYSSSPATRPIKANQGESR